MKASKTVLLKTPRRPVNSHHPYQSTIRRNVGNFHRSGRLNIPEEHLERGYKFWG